MGYVLLYLLVLFVVGCIVKPFIPIENQTQIANNNAIISTTPQRRALHPPQDCLDSHTEHTLLNSAGALKRLGVMYVSYAPNGDLLEQSLYLVLDDDIINPESPALHKFGIYTSPVEGTSYQSEYVLTDAETTPGRPAILEREPDNEHDPNAIIIRDVLTRRNIGYVNTSVAAHIAQLLDDDPTSLQAIFMSGSESGIPDSRVRVLIASPTRLNTLLANGRGSVSINLGHK